MREREGEIDTGNKEGTRWMIGGIYRLAFEPRWIWGSTKDVRVALHKGFHQCVMRELFTRN